MGKTTRSGKTASQRVQRCPVLDVAAYKGKWVAINPQTNKVIGHGISLEAARQSAPNFEREEPVLFFVPASDAFFVGFAA
jgi:hypothetical protein